MLLNVSLCIFDIQAERTMISTSGTFGQSVVFAATTGPTGLVLLASEEIFVLVSFLSLANSKKY